MPRRAWAQFPLNGTDVALLASVERTFRSRDFMATSPTSRLIRLTKIGLVRQLGWGTWEVANEAFWAACKDVPFEVEFLCQALAHRQSLAMIAAFSQIGSVDTLHQMAGLRDRTQNTVIVDLQLSELVRHPDYRSYELTDSGHALRPLADVYLEMHRTATNLPCIYQRGVECAWVSPIPNPPICGFESVQHRIRPDGSFIVYRGRRRLRGYDWLHLHFRALANLQPGQPLIQVPDDLGAAGNWAAGWEFGFPHEGDRSLLYQAESVRRRVLGGLGQAGGEPLGAPGTPAHEGLGPGNES